MAIITGVADDTVTGRDTGLHQNAAEHGVPARGYNRQEAITGGEAAGGKFTLLLNQRFINQECADSA